MPDLQARHGAEKRGELLESYLYVFPMAFVAGDPALLFPCMFALAEARKVHKNYSFWALNSPILRHAVRGSCSCWL